MRPTLTLEDLYNSIEYTKDFPNEGVNFANILPLLNNPNTRQCLSNFLINSIPEHVDTIVAPEVRGMLLAYLIPTYKVVPIRKAGKLPNPTITKIYKTEYSTDVLQCNEKSLGNCWFIDDIFATGGTYEAVKEIVQDLGGHLLGGTVLLDVLGNKPDEVIELFSEVK